MAHKAHMVLRWLGIVLLAGLLLIGWLQRDHLATLWADWTGGGAPEQGRPLPVVQLATAERARISERISAIGTLTAPEQVTVTAETAGRVAAVRFREGDRVQRHQALLILERERAAAAVQEAAAQVQRQAKSLERREELATQDYVAESELDRAEASAEQARAELRIAAEDLANQVVEAPFGGVVGRRLVSPGAFVEPGTPVATLSEVSDLDLLFDVPGARLGRVELGQRVEATTPAFPQRTFEGEVTFVGTQVDAGTRTLPVEATFDNADRLLKPGMFLDLALITGERQVVRVPEAAVVTRGPSAIVYALDDDASAGKSDTGPPDAATSGGARNTDSAGEPTPSSRNDKAPMVARRPVSTGVRRDGWVEITDGVSAGERVVVAGLQGLRDGMRVRIAPGQPDQPAAGAPPRPSSGGQAPSADGDAARASAASSADADDGGRGGRP